MPIRIGPHRGPERCLCTAAAGSESLIEAPPFFERAVPDWVFQEKRPASLFEHAFTGLLLGGLAGAGAFWVLERTNEHPDHSEDEFVLVTLTVTGAGLGAIAGMVVAAIRR